VPPTTLPRCPKNSDSTDVTFTVLYDANVLYPNVLRDVLIRLAQTGLVHARWTEKILDETFRNLAADRPDIPTDTLSRLRASTPGSARVRIAASAAGYVDTLRERIESRHCPR